MCPCSLIGVRAFAFPLVVGWVPPSSGRRVGMRYVGIVPEDGWWEVRPTAGVEGCDSNDSVLSLSGCIFGVGRGSSGGVPGTERSTRPAPSCLGMEARFFDRGLGPAKGYRRPRPDGFVRSRDY